MRILICGQRDFTDKKFLFDVMDDFVKHLPAGVTIEIVIEGGAKGADQLGRAWAIARGFEFQTFEADWDKYHRARAPFVTSKCLMKVNPIRCLHFITTPTNQKAPRAW